MTLKNINTAKELAQFALYYQLKTGQFRIACRAHIMLTSLVITGWMFAGFLYTNSNFIPILGVLMIAVVIFQAKDVLKKHYLKHFEIHYTPESRLRGHVGETETLEITPTEFVIHKDFSKTSVKWTNVELQEDQDFYYIFITPIVAVIINKKNHSTPESVAFIEFVKEKSTI